MTRLTGIITAAVLAASAAFADAPRVAEDQTPTGKFLTATEARPIIEATKGSWIAVREYDGQDLLYFTHLLSWRCGLYEIKFGLNGGEKQVFAMPDCMPDNPNATPPDATIYLTYPLGSIETVEIELLYDDLGTSNATYNRADVQIN